MGNDEEGRARRARLRRMGMQNTGILSRPGAGPAEPAPASQAPEAAPPPEAPAPAPPPKPKSAPAVPTQLSSDERSLAEDIEKRFKALAKDDHFARLGIPRTSGTPQVKSAFVVLAQRFHPDKLPASLANLKDKGQALFEGIRESYEVLVDDGARLNYLATLKAPGTGPAPAVKRGPTPEALLEAKKFRSQAEMSIRRKLFAEAEQLFAKAAAITTAANDVAGQAWARYLDPARAGDPKVNELLKTALTMDPHSDRALYVSGVIARAANDLEAAERHFRNALAANPDHADAALELRLLARRREASKKGLFGR
jgi:curved DNA-binding protein CbpA